MAVNILRDVNATIGDLLKDIEINDHGDTLNVIFDSPGDMDEATHQSQKPFLSVFLYQTTINTQLRNEPARPVGTSQLKYPPLILDLYYLFTAHADGSDARETELMIMEEVMRTFHDYAVFKKEDLADGLAGTDNENIKIVPNVLSMDDLNKIWATFPNKPFKLSLAYLFSPVRVPSAKEAMPVKRVATSESGVERINRGGSA